jgi:hypothetical protein
MLILSNSDSASSQIFSDDVFSSYVYTGNGSTQTINNGIDLAGKGGLVWTKRRDSISAHVLADSVRGNTNCLQSHLTSASVSLPNAFTSFNLNGFSLGTQTDTNTTAATYISWTFRKAPKFFDVVTFTANGSGGGSFSHALGATPAVVILKATNNAENWLVYHKDLTSGYTLNLNTATAQTNQGVPVFSTLNSTSAVITNGILTAGSITYVAYLFAHDTSTDGLIQCGSFTTDGSGNASVTLGWEPQYLLNKPTAIGDWALHDDMRGFPVDTAVANLLVNSSGAEGTSTKFRKNATGFTFVGGASATYIYLAIRRPNKPPTTGTQVYNAIARTSNGVVTAITGVGFPPDLAIDFNRPGSFGTNLQDRLRGATLNLKTTDIGAESAIPNSVTSFDQNGITVSTGSTWNTSNIENYIYWFFKRAPGVFDEVCYTGTGAVRTVAHNLGAIPEMMIIKRRDLSGDWPVYHKSLTSAVYSLYLNSTSAQQTDTPNFNGTDPTSSVFTVGTSSVTNASAGTYVAYLFATKAGISKVGSYTGNGSSLTLDMGFTTGARFFLVKATSTTGSWWVFDSVRGIVSAADPALQLNSTAAEITSADACDPDASGIIVNQEATCSINATGVSYVFLALA